VDRKRLALVLLVPAALVVVAVGVSRSADEDSDTPTAVPGLDVVAGDEAATAAVLQPAGDVIEVPEGSDCVAAGGSDPSPQCQAFQVRDGEVAWLVEDNSSSPIVASFLQRTSPTSWTRVLAGEVPVGDTVNVRLEDLTGDGAIDVVYAFHHDNAVQVDVVDSTGTVLLHAGLSSGMALVADGTVTTFQREGDRWRKRVVKLEDGQVEVVSDEVVEGPVEGNI
jgi:hypothetical protein